MEALKQHRQLQRRYLRADGKTLTKSGWDLLKNWGTQTKRGGLVWRRSISTISHVLGITEARVNRAIQWERKRLMALAEDAVRYKYRQNPDLTIEYLAKWYGVTYKRMWRILNTKINPFWLNAKPWSEKYYRWEMIGTGAKYDMKSIFHERHDTNTRLDKKF